MLCWDTDQFIPKYYEEITVDFFESLVFVIESKISYTVWDADLLQSSDSPFFHWTWDITLLIAFPIHWSEYLLFFNHCVVQSFIQSAKSSHTDSVGWHWTCTSVCQISVFYKPTLVSRISWATTRQVVTPAAGVLKHWLSVKSFSAVLCVIESSKNVKHKRLICLKKSHSTLLVQH